MNKFIEFKKLKQKLPKKRIRTKKEIYKDFFKVSNSRRYKHWKNYDLLPKKVIDIKDFLDWVKITRPNSYNNLYHLLSLRKISIEELELETILNLITGGDVFDSKISKEYFNDSISKEYSLVNGRIGESYFDERQVEIIVDYAIINDDVYNYIGKKLIEAFRYINALGPEEDEITSKW